MKCQFCGKTTDFIAHSEHLCLHCGDAMLAGSPLEQVKLVKGFAACCAALATAEKRIRELEA